MKQISAYITCVRLRRSLNSYSKSFKKHLRHFRIFASKEVVPFNFTFPDTFSKEIKGFVFTDSLLYNKSSLICAHISQFLKTKSKKWKTDARGIKQFLFHVIALKHLINAITLFESKDYNKQLENIL